MKKFIFGERSGVHIIDLRKTQILIEYARDVIHEIAASGQIVLFVGTKTDTKDVIEEQAIRANMNYVSERWLGGMLTNFATIRRSINRLANIDRMETDGTFDNITKKERLLLGRERERLRKVFGGIETMTRTPGALFVIDAKKEHLAVKEARVLGIPVIGVIDTNTDPDLVDYPIPANDDSVRTAEIIASVMADTIIEATATARARKAEFGFDSNQKEKNYTRDNEKTQRKFRDRGDRRDGRDGGSRPRRDNRDRDGGSRPRRTDSNRTGSSDATANPTASTPTE